MAMDAVLGAVDYTLGGGIDYTPVIYGKQLLVEYLEKAVVPGVTNTDYQGDIKDMGSKVIIQVLPEVTVEDLPKGAAIGEYEELSAASTELSIDFRKVWKFKIEQVDAAQASFVLAPKFMQKAEYAMEVAIDGHWFTTTRSQGATENMGNGSGKAGVKSTAYTVGVTTSPVTLTKDNVIGWIADLAAVLSEQSVPRDAERHLSLPTCVANLINKSELQDASYAGQGESLIWRNAWIGRLGGFNVHESNNVYSATVNAKLEWSVIANHRSACAFATQIVESDKLKDTKYAGTFYRGFQVYGFNTINPKGLAVSIVTV